MSTQITKNNREVINGVDTLTNSPTPVTLTSKRVNVNANITSGLINVAYDYIAVAYPIGIQEIYTFYIGGSGGNLVATITVNYIDNTKANLLNVAKT